MPICHHLKPFKCLCDPFVQATEDNFTVASKVLKTTLGYQSAHLPTLCLALGECLPKSDAKFGYSHNHCPRADYETFRADYGNQYCPLYKKCPPSLYSKICISM